MDTFHDSEVDFMTHIGNISQHSEEANVEIPKQSQDPTNQSKPMHPDISYVVETFLKRELTYEHLVKLRQQTVWSMSTTEGDKQWREGDPTQKSASYVYTIPFPKVNNEDESERTRVAVRRSFTETRLGAVPNAEQNATRLTRLQQQGFSDDGTEIFGVHYELDVEGAFCGLTVSTRQEQLDIRTTYPYDNDWQILYRHADGISKGLSGLPKSIRDIVSDFIERQGKLHQQYLDTQHPTSQNVSAQGGGRLETPSSSTVAVDRTCRTFASGLAQLLLRR